MSGLFFLRFGVEEIVYHGDDGIAPFHQRNVCRVRENGQPGFRARSHVAKNLVALYAEHLSDVVQSDAVGIAVYEKKRRLGGLEFIGSEIAWLYIHRNDALGKVRELIGRRTELFVLGLDGRAFEGVGCQLRKHVERFLDPAVVTENGRNTDNFAHFLRMTDSNLHRDPAAHTVTKQIGA